MNKKNWLLFIFIITLIFSVNLIKPFEVRAFDKKIYVESDDTSDNISDVNNARKNAITNAVEKCSPAIVGINITEVHQVEYRDPMDFWSDDPFFQRFFGNHGRQKRVREYTVQGLGSGFIISPDGYILTNHHVAGSASKIVVTTTSGRKYDAEIIGADKTSDVCLLKIKATKEDKDGVFPYLKFANSDKLIIGEWVIAFGNPFGLFDMNAKPTVTVGVVSNKEIDFLQEDRVYRNMIQTDAAISSGNSGGPLVNSLGEVVGMNTVIFSTAQSQQGAGSIGIGFSIPINRIKKVIDLLAKDKTINRNFVTGIEVRDIDEQIANYLKTELKTGVVVFSINRRSPAEEAGFEPGDIILEIDGEKIQRTDDFYLIVNDGIAGQTLTFTLLRDDKKITKTLKLKPLKK